jgi:hypothetical protein
MNVNGDRHHIPVQSHHRWPASSGQRTHCPFAHPVLAYELFHDLRDGASSKAGTPREVGARNGLAGPDQLEDNIPVDDPRCLTRGELHFSQINVLYAVPVMPQFSKTSAVKNAINLTEPP